ncbi:MAG: DUF4956 domain-containing protein [Gemmatimonadales bacterium]
MSDSWGKVLEQVWRPAVRLAGYYLLLLLVHFALVALFPWFGEQLRQVPMGTGVPGTDLTATQAFPAPTSSLEAGAAAILTMTGALVLVLPVVWVYTFTRQRRGFQQSLAQTLVILPIVVAVVVILVKHSVALAFSLGGIVGAVAFRHRLEDTKDAVYIFVTIAIGLSVGMQAYSVALATSAFYNLVSLGLWATDFARAPAPLAAEILERRVRLAKGMVNDKRTGEYVAQLDQHLLQSMTPDQLKALADRALEHTYKRQQESDPAIDPRLVTLVARAPTSAAVQGLKATIAAVLDREAKEWRLQPGGEDDNALVLRYQVRCRKRVPPQLLLESVRLAAGPLDGDCALE